MAGAVYLDCFVIVVGIDMTYPEIGYTPANLRYWIEQHGLTQAQTAEYLGVQTRTVRMWLTETDKTSHRDMPLEKWRLLQQYQKSEV